MRDYYINIGYIQVASGDAERLKTYDLRKLE